MASQQHRSFQAADGSQHIPSLHPYAGTFFGIGEGLRAAGPRRLCRLRRSRKTIILLGPRACAVMPFLVRFALLAPAADEAPIVDS